MKPLAVDLFCGLGGWTEGLLAEGYNVVGFDVERHAYGDAKYPAQLVLQDVLTIHGKQFKDAALIVASPPCQEYSYMAMPWSRAKAIAADYRSGKRDTKQLTALFDACFRIQREACEAAGHHIPMVVENVRGAIPWVGRSRWNFGSFHLWGDVPALMPIPVKRHAKVGDISFSGYGEPGYKSQAFSGTAEKRLREEGHKVPGFRSDGSGKSFQSASVEGVKGVPHKPTGHRTNPDENGSHSEGVKGVGRSLNRGAPKWITHESSHMAEVGIHVGRVNRPDHTQVIDHERGTKGYAARLGDSQISRRHGSKSNARKAASAMIAKIPFVLSQHIARVYKPE